VDVADHAALDRLQRTYGDVVTRRAWGELGDLFVDRCPITIDTRVAPPVELAGAEELGRFIAGAIERFEVFVFARLNGVWSDDGSTGRMYIHEIRRDAAGVDSDAFGVYDDEHQRAADGTWRFARRRYTSLLRR
jgi:hypothetical protein